MLHGRLADWKIRRVDDRGATVRSVTDTLPPSRLGLYLDESVRRVDRGRILIGGAPLRIMKLSAAGADLVDAWADGEPLGETSAHRRLARRLLDAGMAHPRPIAVPVPDVTVIVPVHNNVDGLDRCLTAIGNIAVVVVDDASSDAVSHRRVAREHGVGYIRRTSNGGPAAARITGMEDVTSEFVAFVDSDLEVRSGWLSGLCGHFDDPAVVAVAPRVRSRRGSGLLAGYERFHSPLDLGDAPGPVGPGRAISYVPTAALVVRVAAINDVGGFDPDLRWGEDVDLIWRLTDAGGVVLYEPTVEVVHDPRPNWRAWLNQRRRYGTSAASLGKRHGSKVAPARCSRWSAVAWAMNLAGYRVAGAAVAVGSTAALARKLESIPHPVAEAVRLAGRGHLYAGLGLDRTTARVWWPPALLLAAFRPSLRKGIAVAIVAPAAVDWANGKRPAGPVKSISLRTLDHMAYGFGVWEGMLRERSITPLLPDFSEWPGRKAAVDETTVSDQ